jgi:hypothetical protein
MDNTNFPTINFSRVYVRVHVYNMNQTYHIVFVEHNNIQEKKWHSKT